MTMACVFPEGEEIHRPGEERGCCLGASDAEELGVEVEFLSRKVGRS
jgi:hypothetical protein